MSEKITQHDIEKMVRHWFATPIYSYLGSDYGFDKEALKFNALSMNQADEVIAKLRRDVPVLSMLDIDAINLYHVPQPPDKLHLFIQIGETHLRIM